MSELTITEALAELKLIDKKISSIEIFILEHLSRPEALKDPLEKDGGQQKVVAQKLQTISDHNERKVAIRTAINHANEITEITVAGITRTIAEWLIWRREVADNRFSFLTRLSRSISNVRRDARDKNLQIVGKGDSVSSSDVHINVDELELQEEIEQHNIIMETLDGQLSLKNATVVIELK